MAEFSNLYDYNVEGGVILPQTSTIKSAVESAFKEIFGADFSTDETTIGGRLIEAITLHFVDVCRVNAQNVNALNIERAIGLYLDNLGSAYGIVRSSGESDYSYRKRIIGSFSRGSGFASSIRNALNEVDGVLKCVVLDNGNEDPQVLPRDVAGNTFDHSIAIKPHSVGIFLITDSSVVDSQIAEAIRASKSAGCGFENSSTYGTAASETVTEDGTSFTATYYKTTQRYVRVSVTVSKMAYTGTNIVTDAKAAVKDLFDTNNINSTVTKEMVAAALASNGLGIICTDYHAYVSDVNATPTSAEEVSGGKVVVPAYKHTAITNELIEVIAQ